MPMNMNPVSNISESPSWGAFHPVSRGSSLKGASFSSALAWAQEQAQKDEALQASQDNKNYLKENIKVMTCLLESVSSNPLQENGVEGIRILQGLVESISRLHQEETLKQMDAHLQENNFLQAAALVGRKGEFLSHHFKVGPGSADEVFYEISSGKPIEDLVIELYGSHGGKIAGFEGPKEVGRHNLADVLKNLKPGAYSFQVWGVDEEGEQVEVQHIVSSRVDSVKKEGNELLARVGQAFEPLRYLRGVGLIEEQNETHIVPLPPQLAHLLGNLPPESTVSENIPLSLSNPSQS